MLERATTRCRRRTRAVQEWYRGAEEVPKGYRGLQRGDWVTASCMWLQRATTRAAEGYNGLQRATEGCRGLSQGAEGALVHTGVVQGYRGGTKGVQRGPEGCGRVSDSCEWLLVATEGCRGLHRGTVRAALCSPLSTWFKDLLMSLHFDPLPQYRRGTEAVQRGYRRGYRRIQRGTKRYRRGIGRYRRHTQVYTRSVTGVQRGTTGLHRRYQQGTDGYIRGVVIVMVMVGVRVRRAP